eukprot:9199220-Pyramimonas_sp.AAC.1
MACAEGSVGGARFEPLRSHSGVPALACPQAHLQEIETNFGGSRVALPAWQTAAGTATPAPSSAGSALTPSMAAALVQRGRVRPASSIERPDSIIEPNRIESSRFDSIDNSEEG